MTSFRDADIGVLMGLLDYRERFQRGRVKWEWARPMDIGGRAGNGYSQALARLVKLGMAERRQRPDAPTLPRSRPSFEYRLTQVGCDLLRQRKIAGLISSVEK